MWYVIHFPKDNSVEAVPSTWYKNGNCAWPNKPINAVRAIQKRIQPNTLDFQWFKARKLGSFYGNYIVSYIIFQKKIIYSINAGFNQGKFPFTKKKNIFYFMYISVILY